MLLSVCNICPAVKIPPVFSLLLSCRDTYLVHSSPSSLYRCCSVSSPCFSIVWCPSKEDSSSSYSLEPDQLLQAAFAALYFTKGQGCCLSVGFFFSLWLFIWAYSRHGFSLKPRAVHETSAVYRRCRQLSVGTVVNDSVHLAQ